VLCLTGGALLGVSFTFGGTLGLEAFLLFILTTIKYCLIAEKMDVFMRRLIDIPIDASELVTWTQLYRFKPNSLLEDFLTLHKCLAPAVFHGLQLLHDIRYIIIHMEYYDINNIDVLPKNTLIQKALGCYARTPADLKRLIMNQLILLKRMPNQTIYDKLTDNYSHYDTVVETPAVLRRLYKQIVGKSVGRHTRTFAEALALFQQMMAGTAPVSDPPPPSRSNEISLSRYWAGE
jgi:hypothetical protein